MNELNKKILVFALIAFILVFSISLVSAFSFREFWNKIFKTGKVVGNLTSSSDAGLVLYMPFNEGNGTIVQDSSGNNNYGTIYGATWVDGKSGKALSFDGTNDYIKIAPKDIYKTQPVSVGAWIKTKGTTIAPPNYLVNLIVNYENNNGYYGWSFQVNELNKLYFSWNDYTGRPIAIVMTSNSTIDDGNWHYVVATDDGTTMTLYIDGNNKGSANSTTPQWATAMYAYIGAVRPERGSALYWFNGTIDEVRIWNRSLSATEVQRLYNAYALPSNITNATTGCPNNLCAYYKFDEGAGTTAADASGSGNTGAIYGATWVDGKSGKALSFDGTNDYVRVDPFSPSISGTNSYTIITWVKPGNNPSTSFPKSFIWEGKINSESGILSAPSIEGTNIGFYYWIGNTRYIGTGALTEGQWYHIAAVYDESAQRQELFVNGISKGYNSINANDTINVFYIGARWRGAADGVQYPFNGTIDEVRIYDRALSAAEVQRLYGVTNITTNISRNINISRNVANITTSCADSDGGLNYAVKGNVERCVRNRCLNYNDSCPSSRYLLERYCAGRTGTDLGAKAYRCPLGCSNGACIITNATNQTITNRTCRDSDNGQNFYTKGTATITPGGGSSTDYCSNRITLMEFFCTSTNNIDAVNYVCSSCINGACATTNQTNATNQTQQRVCTDSDGGKNYTVKGTSTITGGGSSTDYCSNRITLREFFCTATNNIDAVNYVCSSCINGACIITNATLSNNT